VKTPREKYENDVDYHNLVDLLESFIEKCELTPSEIREAAMLACIHYEARRPNLNHQFPYFNINR
jgi:hypothetical protein